MHSLRTLYGYELKKIWKRKIVRITLLVCLAAVFISVTGPAMGSHYVDNEKADSKYHIFLADREYNRQLSGRESTRLFWKKCQMPMAGSLLRRKDTPSPRNTRNTPAPTTPFSVL